MRFIILSFEYFLFKAQRGQRAFKSLHSSVKCNVKINKLMLHGKYIVIYTYLR